MSITIKFCGAAQNVTGSQHLLNINGCRILLDSGLFQGGDREKNLELNKQFLFNPAEIDFLIISHAHIDHIGRVPLLVKQGFKGKIFCTRATFDLAELMLMDTAHIQSQEAQFLQKEQSEFMEPLYNQEDVIACLGLFETYEYFQKFKISENIWATFFDAGHVLGSMITVLEFKDENGLKKLVYTGDLGRKYMPILNDPYQINSADFLIIESTYASRVHDSFATVADRLAEMISRVAKRGGKIIVPGFSLERTQALVYVLHQLYNEKRIPILPIFVDSPLSAEISKVFEQNNGYYDKETFREFLAKKESPLYFKDIKYISAVDDSKNLNKFRGSCIIISASGMCEAGRIKHHLKYHMVDKKNLILVIGFMAAGTRGRKIVEGEKNISIFGEMYPLNAEVAVLNAFSAHADKIELLEYVKNISDLNQIFIVHGEENECLVMRDNIKNILKFNGKVDVADMGEEFVLEEKIFVSQNHSRSEEYLEEMNNLKLKV